jgi:hypothetical protein
MYRSREHGRWGGTLNKGQLAWLCHLIFLSWLGACSGDSAPPAVGIEEAAGSQGSHGGGAGAGGSRDEVGNAGSGGNVDTIADGNTDSVGGSDGGFAESGSDAAERIDPFLCPGRLFCDGFDQDTVGQVPGPPWIAQTENGRVVIDGTHAYSGKSAVKVSTDAGLHKQATIAVRGAPLFPVKDNALYGRMMVYVDVMPTGTAHWFIATASGSLPGYPGAGAFYAFTGWPENGSDIPTLLATYDTYGLHCDSAEYNADYCQRTDNQPGPKTFGIHCDGQPLGCYPGPVTDCGKHSVQQMPEKQWVCAEWYFNGNSNTLNFWVNGQDVKDMDVVNKGQYCVQNDLKGVWLGPVFDRLSVGWTNHHPDSGARQVWIDDVVVDSKRIGCPVANTSAF